MILLIFFSGVDLFAQFNHTYSDDDDDLIVFLENFFVLIENNH